MTQQHYTLGHGHVHHGSILHKHVHFLTLRNRLETMLLQLGHEGLVIDGRDLVHLLHLATGRALATGACLHGLELGELFRVH